jgi:Glycosyl Hydrolase Family 88.
MSSDTTGGFIYELYSYHPRIAVLFHLVTGRWNHLSHIKAVVNDLFDDRQSIFDNQIHINGAIQWIFNAQDSLKTGGIPADYCFTWGWSNPYPETSGYIIYSLINYLNVFPESEMNDEIIQRSIWIGDWLLSIQNDNGSYYEGLHAEKKNLLHKNMIIQRESAFETAQIIAGLLSLYKKTHDNKYLDASIKSGDWLIKTQETEGYWNLSHQNKPRSYDVYIGWRLLELYQIVPNPDYLYSAIKVFDWASELQKENGFFLECSHLINRDPWTHGIGYTVEAYIEAYVILKRLNIESNYLSIAQRTADTLLKLYHIRGFKSIYYQDKGFIPASFNENWESKVKFMHLSGCAQIALCWLKLFEITRDYRYLNAGIKLNKDIKSIQNLHSNNKGIRGGIKGSHPIWGFSSPFRFTNHSVKFFIDSLLEESLIMKKERGELL